MTVNPSTPSNPLAWDKPWIISLVALICTLFLIITYYKLLRRLCLRLYTSSLSRNPNQRRRILNEVNQNDLSLQFQSHGLNFYVIRSLPVTRFKKKDEAEAAEDNSSSNTDCAICLGEFEDGDWLKHLPKCSHAFHISCIDTWFESHSNCPLCRSQVYGFMHEFPVPMDTTLETLSEDVIQERAAHYQMLRIAVLESSQIGREARYAQ